MVTDGMSSRSLIGNNIVCRNMVYIILHREFEVHEIYVRNGSIISFHTYIRYVIYIIYIWYFLYVNHRRSLYTICNIICQSQPGLCSVNLTRHISRSVAMITR